MAKHAPQFLKLVQQIKSRIKELTVDQVKDKLDRKEPFRVHRRARGERVVQRPHRRRDASRQRCHRARTLSKRLPDTKYADRAFTVAAVFRSALAAVNLQKNGLYQRLLDGWGHPRMAAERFADHFGVS